MWDTAEVKESIKWSFQTVSHHLCLLCYKLLKYLWIDLHCKTYFIRKGSCKCFAESLIAAALNRRVQKTEHFFISGWFQGNCLHLTNVCVKMIEEPNQAFQFNLMNVSTVLSFKRELSQRRALDPGCSYQERQRVWTDGCPRKAKGTKTSCDLCWKTPTLTSRY